MKLGIIVPSEADQFKVAKDLGLDFVEMDMNSPEYWGGKPISEIRSSLPVYVKAQEDTGVELGAVGRWASKILDCSGDIIDDEWNEVKSIIDIGHELGSKYYLCSVAYVKELSYYKNITAAIKVLNKIVSYAASKGMETAIVNCIMGDNYIRTPEQWRLVLDEVPGLGIKYDPSHSFVHGGKTGAYMEEALNWGDKFKYIHIKGVIQGDGHDEKTEWFYHRLIKEYPEISDELNKAMEHGRKVYDNPPAGIDSINRRAFFGILYKFDYDGYLSIEPHSPSWRGEKGMKGVKYTIKYIRDLMI
jgi:sugar phosphate isomerase/epimerase